MLDRINPLAYNQFRTPYHERALQALEPLRKALGYEPRLEVIPDQVHASIAPAAAWDHRLTVPHGSWLFALSGSSQQPEGYNVQITDLGTRRNLFSGAIAFANVTGEGNTTVLDSAGSANSMSSPLHLLPIPRPITAPGLMNVQILNLSGSANQVQLVLWIWEPKIGAVDRNEWNDALDQEISNWMAAGSSPDGGGSNTPLSAQVLSDPAFRTPAYNRSFDIASVGDNVIISGAQGLRIAIHELSLFNTAAQTIDYIDYGGSQIRGSLPLGTGGTDYLPYHESPHFVLNDGGAFVLRLSAGFRVTGFLKYRLLRSWTPGQ